MPTLHQISDAATIGDAITDQILLIRRWLREMGYTSEIYAQHIADEMAGQIRSLDAYRPSSSEKYLVYHHSIGSDAADRVLTLPQQQIMVYHNITPPDFFTGSDPALARQLERGRQQLVALRSDTVLGLGDSPYNEQELRQLGYGRTGVLPITFDDGRYTLPSNPLLVDQFNGRGPLLLFVGRLVPNKRQEDLVKLLHYYRRIRPDAQLVLVGAGWLPGYERWVRDLALDLGLRDAVTFAGHVSQQDMITYFRLADLYVSMSEHEGFGKPLIESMHLGLPVLAHAAASVPGTMGDAGVLFHYKNLPALAELVDILIHNEGLRRRLVIRGRARAQDFSQTAVRAIWQGHLQTLGLA